MVKVEDKKRNNNPVKKISMQEDEVHGEEVNRATQMLSALSVENMTIMQRTVTQTSVLVVVKSYIFPKIASLGMEEKR